MLVYLITVDFNFDHLFMVDSAKYVHCRAEYFIL